ncbi:hypothetical protein RGUI_1063 [Rhodovulum sp. P5]|uniref:SHOCT domain-containing protein n=1 Tax=Rhodovulum sp. P5 TaxID=1564506 RepID=UPI0009C26477|nr:SHOCT domain-containing protein [Rhodovulum sp. P5]ARE39204.1 hypothetical protein RGUI_1063 [Rhodovulum sp. P5]
MTRLTPEGEKIVADIADRHAVSSDAVQTLLFALVQGGGTQAQFNHPDLGGMGQWSAGGMTMIGDMFNNALKAKVDALCSDLSDALRTHTAIAPTAHPAMSQSQSSGPSLFVSGSGIGGQAWPSELGTPSSTGSQNDMRYAVFPDTQRLAIDVGGKIDIYDTGDHRISGVSQQQSGDRTLTFVSQHGPVSLAGLRKLSVEEAEEPAARPAPNEAVPTDSPADAQATEAAKPAPSPAAVQAPHPAEPVEGRASGAEDTIALIRKLSDLKNDGILTEEEFAEKKAELLKRL